MAILQATPDRGAITVAARYAPEIWAMLLTAAAGSIAAMTMSPRDFGPWAWATFGAAGAASALYMTATSLRGLMDSDVFRNADAAQGAGAAGSAARGRKGAAAARAQARARARADSRARRQGVAPARGTLEERRAAALAADQAARSRLKRGFAALGVLPVITVAVTWRHIAAGQFGDGGILEDTMLSLLFGYLSVGLGAVVGFVAMLPLGIVVAVITTRRQRAQATTGG